VRGFTKNGLGILLLAAMVATDELPFLATDSQDPSVVRSIVENESQDREARERALGDQRPGFIPPEATQGSGSGTTVGRADNPWNTRGRPLRGDQWD
jgi:hypothetical protein